MPDPVRRPPSASRADNPAAKALVDFSEMVAPHIVRHFAQYAPVYAEMGYKTPEDVGKHLIGTALGLGVGAGAAATLGKNYVPLTSMAPSKSVFKNVLTVGGGAIGHQRNKPQEEDY